MNSVNKFALGKQPFIRKADSYNQNTATIMRDFILALSPLIIFAWVKNGLLPYVNNDSSFIKMLYPLLFVVAGGLFTYAIEYIYYFFTSNDKEKFSKKNALATAMTVKYSFAVIPGLILAMILPLNTPIWVLFMSCLFATLIGKLLFGGFACNVFNPALVGYLFFQVAYIAVSNKNGGYLNPSEAITIVSGATPLSNFSTSQLASGTQLMEPYGGFWNFLIGTIPGSLAETSSILCILSCAFLIYRKVINWRIPVFYVGGVFVITYVIAAINGNPADYLYPLFHVCSGGLLFGATFMATEPITSPRTPNGKIVYGLSLAVLTVLLRFKGNLPEGVATSIMAMNLFTIIIDRVCAIARARNNVKKSLTTYGVIALVLIGISTYTIAGTTSIITANVEYVKVEQDLANISKDKFFQYTFNVNDEEVVVYTDFEGNITSISNENYDKEYFTDQYVTSISNNIPNVYYKKVSKDDSQKYHLEISTKGYAKNPFTVYFIYDNNYNLLEMKVVKVLDDGDYSESYDNEYNEEWTSNIRPELSIPEQIVNGSSADNVNIVSGATFTSNALKSAAKLAEEYISKLKNGSIIFNAFQPE